MNILIMHQSSLNNMKKMLDTILTKEFTNQPRKILEYPPTNNYLFEEYFFDNYNKINTL